MAFLDFLFGKKAKMGKTQPAQLKQAPIFTGKQQNILNSILGQAGGQLGQGFNFLQSILSQNPEINKQFEAPLLRQFNEEIIPSIAERFTGMGAQKSSAFGQQLGKATTGLGEILGSQRGERGFKALDQLQSLLKMGLTPQFSNYFQQPSESYIKRQRQPGLLETGSQNLLEVLPQLAMLAFL
jgi:hypothetical protein